MYMREITFGEVRSGDLVALRENSPSRLVKKATFEYNQLDECNWIRLDFGGTHVEAPSFQSIFKLEFAKEKS